MTQLGGDRAEGSTPSAISSLVRGARTSRAGGLPNSAKLSRALAVDGDLVVVALAPGAEHHRAEAERADLDAGAAEGPELHAGEPT